MAREPHYKYFKDLYDEENKRSSDLNDNAKTNTSLVALYGAFVSLALDRGRIPQNIDRYVFVMAVLCLFVSIFLSLYASQITEYQVSNFPEDVLPLLPTYGDSEELFYEDRIIDLTAACKANSVINDRKVHLLQNARRALLLGIALHLTYCLTLMFA